MQGNPGRRPISQKEPEPERGADAPEWLSPDALEHWPTIARQLDEVGVLTKMDQVALGLYCEAFAGWKNANDRVVKHGAIVKSPNNYPIQSPFLAIANKAHEQMVKLLIEFGMTPAARTKVEVAKKPAKKDSALSKYL